LTNMTRPARPLASARTGSAVCGSAARAAADAAIARRNERKMDRIAMLPFPIRDRGPDRGTSQLALPLMADAWPMGAMTKSDNKPSEIQEINSMRRGVRHMIKMNIFDLKGCPIEELRAPPA